MIVRFKALTHGDDIDFRVKCTASEWEALIAPTVARNLPIDGATVDTEMLDKLMDRETVKGRVKHTVLLV